ncbi:MAG: FAD-dependent monooxygenase [Planctomycetota bacterium]|nr:FAD-dependent monooxygenase [Planctomycetota bacterium]
MYDVIIAGAGPAGATLARLLGERHSVLMLETRNIRNDFVSSGVREKCCAGLGGGRTGAGR